MITDITFKDNGLLLKIHDEFKAGLFQENNQLMEKYSHLGTFHIGGESFGFEGCFKKSEKFEDYTTYTFDFPGNINSISLKRMLSTIYLSGHYVVEAMYSDSSLRHLFKDQSMTLTIFDGSRNELSYAIGGKIYPYFKTKLDSIGIGDTLKVCDNISRLRDYVVNKINFISNNFNEVDAYDSYFSVRRDGLLIEPRSNGYWFLWERACSLNEVESLVPRKLSGFYDQLICFVAITAINSYLRNI